MKIAVLALQGAFIEHESILTDMGIETVELRQKSDLSTSYDALILPGGESTVQGKLLKELDMFDSLHTQIIGGMPVLATCAGLILLADRISNDDKTYFQTLPVTVRRNAYGRQLGSFHTEQSFGDLGDVPMTFIRAPWIESVSPDTEILAAVDGKIVAARYKNQMALSFHPELDKDRRIYENFIQMI